MANITASGNWWRFESGGTLYIYCVGDMPSPEWDDYKSNITAAVIADGVTSIGRDAFYNCTSLTSVTIPDGVTSIAESAFDSCKALTSVTIPDSVTSIGDWAFAGCSALKSVTIGSGVTSIGGGAFYNCDGLTSITIPDNVTSFGNMMFQFCSNLASVTIGNGITSIGEKSFDHCGLTNITISSSVTNIAYEAFNSCVSLTDVYYGGAEEQWNAITISSGNSALSSATIHYSATPTKALESIAITTQPTKTTYTTGETFNASGMIVTATYSDASTATVTGYTTSPTVALTTSDTVITVSYTEGDVTKTATVNITVTESEPEPEPEPEPIAERRMITYNGSSKVARRLCELVSDLYAAPRLFVDAEGYISVVYQEGNDGD